MLDETILEVADSNTGEKKQDDLHHQLTLFQLSFEPILAWDFDTGIVFWNQGCNELYGYSISEALGKSSHSLLKSEFPISFDDYWQTLEKTERWTGRIRHTAKDGRVLTVESRQMLISIKGKRLVLEANRDVTEQSLADEKLRAAEERYRAFIEQSSEGIWRFELEEPIPINLPVEEQLKLAYERGYLAECNDAMARMYGFDSAEQIIGARISDLFVADDPANEAYLRAFLESGYRLTDAESHEKDLNGRDVYFSNNLVGIVENGKLFRAWGTQRDITGLKESEKVLARYRLLSAQARDIVLMVRSTGEILEANAAAVNAYGYAQAELLTMKIADLRAPEHLSELQHQLKEANQNGILFETVHRRKDGTTFNVEVGSVGADLGGERFLLSIIRDISERKQAEEKLRESEERFRKMADNLPIMIWVTDPDGYCAYLNRLWYKFTEQTPGTGLGLGWISAVHPDDQSRAKEAFLSANESRGEFYVEYRLRRGDGEYRWMIDSAQPRFSENGEFLGYTGSVVDIHERKLIEDQMRFQLNLTQTITDNTQSCLLMMDAEGRGTFANHATERVTGFKPEELIGEVLHYKIHHTRPDGTTFPKEECPLDNALPLHEAVVGYEDVFVHKDGQFYPVRCSGRPIFKDGEPVGTVIEVQDITEEKRAREALLKAERQAAEEYQALLSRIVPLAQTLGTARDLTAIYRAIGDFVRASMPCVGFFVSFYDADKKMRKAAYGWGEGGELEVSDLPPMPLTENGGPNSQAIFQQQTILNGNYRQTMASRPHVLVGEENGITPDSSLVAPMVVMGRIIGTLEVQAYESDAFNQDHIVALEMASNLAAVAIENVRLLEIEANARREAEIANRSKDEFLAVLSHELRTPLNSMFGWVRMLSTGQLDEEKTRRAVEVIERNINLQTKLIEDILDISRIISGKIRLENRQLDLLPLIKSVTEVAQPTAETKGVELTTQFNSEACILQGDAERLQQVVNNLLTNAIKFTPSGGKITVKLDCNETAAELKVIDTGVGIEPEFLPYVFDRFRQADSSSKRKHGGLGLGLAIVKHLVEMHGGEVSAESAGVGKGATFTILLPLQSRTEVTETEKSFAAEEKEPDLGNLNLLVVDDDTDALDMLRTMLSSHGAQVQTSSSAVEALKILEKSIPDVLVSDIGMPEMNGIEFVGKIRQSKNKRLQQIPAIALTAYASAEDRERILAAGFNQYQRKPVNFADLIANIKSQSRKK
ncbi:MAG: PAS domain S-box protein [Acidobacteriota bacterium]|nr:PAS domain S-box protein [Acidobacteriota bacterium]